MAEQLQFLQGTQAKYDALEKKDANTFYYTIDTHKLFLGEILLADASWKDLIDSKTTVEIIEWGADD